MTFFNDSPYCYKCNGIGNIFVDVNLIEKIPNFPLVEKCPLCNGSGMNIKVHNIEKYMGEIIQYSDIKGQRIAIFIKEITRNSSQILLGKELLVVPNDAITFLRSFYINHYPMFDPVYRENIYEALGIYKENT